jgi:hypothetical protein
MRRPSPTRQRLLALAVFGGLALSYPMLGLPSGELFGLPATWLYLFGVWGGLIGLAALLTKREGG